MKLLCTFFVFIFPLVYSIKDLKITYLKDKYYKQYEIIDRELNEDCTKPQLEEILKKQILICLQENDVTSAVMFKQQLMMFYFAKENVKKGDSLSSVIINFCKKNKLDNLYYFAVKESSIELNKFGEYNKSIPRLKEAYSKIQNKKINVFKAEICSELSFGFFKKEQYDSSIFYAKLGYNAAMENKDTTTMISASNTAAVCYKRLFALNKSIQQYKITYKLLKESKASADQNTLVLNNIASLYSDFGHFKDALNISREIFTYYNDNEKLNSQKSVSKIAYLSTHATILNNLKMYKNSLDSLRTAVSYCTETTPGALKMVLYYNLANVHLHLQPKNTDSTSYYIKLAHKYRPYSNYAINIANLYYFDGCYTKNKKNYSKARKCFLEALKYTNNIAGGIKINTLKQLIEIENTTGNYKKSVEYGKELIAVLEENFNSEYNNEAAGYKIEMDVSAKELQIANLKTKQLKILLISYRNKMIAIAAFIICGLMAIAALLTFKTRKNRQIIREKEIKNQFNKKISSLTEENTHAYINGLEQEKERLSKLLHDGICNELLSLEMQLKEKITSAEGEKIKVLREDVRSLSHQLSVPTFVGLNFSQVITQFISEIKTMNCFNVHCYISKPLQEIIIGNKEQTELYRILQECTANIIKYAKAQDAYYTFNYDSGYLLLTIEDNGVGFYPNKVKYGLGINLVKKRVKSLCGEFTLDSKPGDGTLIIIKLKLNYTHGTEDITS
ncbi:MAG: ATP-binding protein [Clostridia bacterium]